MKSSSDWSKSDFQVGSMNEGWTDKIRPLLIGGSVLDIGCAIGRFVDVFDGLDYTGLDISSKSIEIAKRLHPDKKFICADIVDWDWEDYDNIFSWVSLQHIPPPDIYKVFKNMKKHGKNFVLCENLDDVNSTYQWKHDYDKHFEILSSESIIGPVTLMRLK